MNRFFSIANFVGVAVLCALSAIQWHINSRLEASVRQLDQLRVEQTASIAQQGKTIAQNDADLDDLRQRLSMSESDLKTAVDERNRFAAEDNVLKSALDQWMSAVKQRDAALKQYGDLIQKLAADRNDAIGKFNDLASKYNALLDQQR